MVSCRSPSSLLLHIVECTIHLLQLRKVTILHLDPDPLRRLFTFSNINLLAVCIYIEVSIYLPGLYCHSYTYFKQHKKPQRHTISYSSTLWINLPTDITTPIISKRLQPPLLPSAATVHSQTHQIFVLTTPPPPPTTYYITKNGPTKYRRRDHNNRAFHHPYPSGLRHILRAKTSLHGWEGEDRR